MEHDPAVALHLAVAVTPWWSLRGRLAVGYDLLRAACEQVAPEGQEWCTAQLWLGLLAFVTGNSAVALSHHTTAYNALAPRGPSPALVWALWGKFTALLTLNRIPEAAEAARSAYATAQETGDPAAEAMAAFRLGVITFSAGDTEGGLTWMRQACCADPASVPGWVARMCRWMLAVYLFEAGDDAAQQTAEDALTQFRQAGHVYFQAAVLVTMTLIDLRAGRRADAGTHLQEAVELASRIGDSLHVIECLDACGHMCASTGDWADAVTIWTAHAACRQRAGLLLIPQAERRRSEPLRKARRALGPTQVQAAEERGAAMTLAIAAEFAVMLATASPQPQAPRARGQLSAREQELVTLVAWGRTDAQIADALHISIRTVRSHLDRIRDKTGCRRRADLTRLALQEGLV